MNEIHLQVFGQEINNIKPVKKSKNSHWFAQRFANFIYASSGF